MLKDSNILEPLFKKYNLSTIDDLYSIIGFGGLPVTKIITRFKDEYKKQKASVVSEAIIDYVKPKRFGSGDTGVVVKGVENCLVKLSRCCNPVPGDEIVGYVTRGRGVSVHRADCINVKNLENLDVANGERFINVFWDDQNSGKYISDIQIIAEDKPGLVVEVANIVSNMKITLLAINGRILKEGLATVSITVEVSDRADIDKIIRSFWNISGVTSVLRTKI